MGLGYRPAGGTCGCGNELWVPSNAGNFWSS